MSRNPWEIPPLPEKGDEAEGITFEAVGRATSDWEYLEAYLGFIFAVLVGASNSTNAAMRAYGSVVAFKGRCGMLQAAAEAFFADFPDPELQKKFDTLEIVAGKLSGRRNEIAHGIVQPYFVAGKGEVGTALVPSYHATNKRRLDVGIDAEYPQTAVLKYAYTSIEIGSFCGHFQDLSKRAMALYRDLVAHRFQSEKRLKASNLAQLLKDQQHERAQVEGPNPKTPTK